MASKKAPIFSALEKEVLMNLVNSKLAVVENKHTDTASTAKKQRGWDEIAVEFNSSPGVLLRNARQLKKCWKNIKMRAKKKIVEERKLRILNGGNPVPSMVCQETLRVMQMIPSQVPSFDDIKEDINSQSEDIGQSQQEELQPEIAFHNVKKEPDDEVYTVISAELVPETEEAYGPPRREQHVIQVEECTGSVVPVFRKRKRITVSQRQTLTFKKKQHQLIMKTLEEKRVFQQKLFEKEMEILELKKAYHEHKLKQLNT